jgi:hypothetical protein
MSLYNAIYFYIKNVFNIFFQPDEVSHATNGVCTNGLGHHGIPILEGPPSKFGSKKEPKSPKLFRAKIVETERGVSFEFGKFVALISFSGKTLNAYSYCYSFSKSRKLISKIQNASNSKS